MTTRWLMAVFGSLLASTVARADVEDAANRLKARNRAVEATIMVSDYRAAAKSVEKTRDLDSGMTYTNVPGSAYTSVQGSVLADDLMPLRPRYASGVMVTPVVPAVSGYSTIVLEYKTALAKYLPGEAPASVLIQAFKRAGPQRDNEKLIDVLANTRNLDLGLGTLVGFGRAEHQASHKDLGNCAR